MKLSVEGVIEFGARFAPGLNENSGRASDPDRLVSLPPVAPKPRPGVSIADLGRLPEVRG